MQNITGAIELCELCGEPLDADSCYGTDDFPLCREHHDLFAQMVALLIGGKGTKQLALFEGVGRIT
jgi:hypothetical protein